MRLLGVGETALATENLEDLDHPYEESDNSMVLKK